jgi:S-adenosylmethionine:tRNA ribosyltransferase-isomerase
MNPRDIRIEDYFYELPQEKIALHPLPERDASKLLHYEQGSIHDRRFKELPELLKASDLLVFNDSRVIHARLIFQTESGHRVEIFCLQPREGYASLAEQGRGSSVWECLVGGNRKWKSGQIRLESSSAAGEA